ncbi:hypothetical protein Tco_1030147 [Tanacetum coccineum]|uniref:Uncharacterized protein n=1 Tax=Tanacetum coccineum TaxID=301880 RepID=A0ABQ5G5F5_9ASTR
MSTQQDIYAAGSENRPPMLNKENYVPWSSRLLRYAKSRPNGKLIYNSIMNGPYVRRMIPEPGDADREVLMANSNNPFNYPVFHQDQPSSSTYMQQPLPNNNNNYNPQSSFNQNYMQQPMPNPKNITDPTTAMNMALVLMAKAFKLNYSTPTNNNQRISSNPRNRQIAQPGMNMGQDRQMQMVVQNPGVQNVRNHNGLLVVPGIANQNPNGNGNVVAARAEGNAIGNNVRPRRRDAAYIQTQLLIAQKEEAGIQIQAEEFDLMAAAADLDEIEEVNANYGSAEVHNYENIYDNEIFNMFTQEEQYTELLKPIPEPHQVQQNDSNVISESSSVEQDGGTEDQHLATVEETRAYFESLYNYLAIEVEKLSKEKSTVSSLLEEKKRLKFDFKIREDELLDKQIQLENKIKKLDNILVKMGQSIQTMHMLSPKPDSFYHTEQKMALGYQNPFYLKKAQQKQQSLYNGKVLLEKHDPPAVYDSEETLQLAQESRLKMKQLNKEIKSANYTKINHLSGVFVSQTAKSREELYFSNTSKTANVFKPISIPNEEFSDDTTLSVARKFLNEVKSIIVTLQRVVKQKMTLDIHNWSSSVHQEIHKIVKDEIFPIVNQVDARLQNFEIQFLKEAAKFVRDFKSLAKEADESLAKHKALELEIERLLRAVVRFSRINPFNASRVNNFVPNKNVKARVRSKSLTVSQPYVVTKEDVSSNKKGFSPNNVESTTRTKRPQPRNNPKNDKVPSRSKSSCLLNNLEKIEENHKSLQSSSYLDHTLSAYNNIKLAIRNEKSEVICATCKQCLITDNHDECMLYYVNGMKSRKKNQSANVSKSANQKKHKPKVWKHKKVGSKEILASPKPSTPRSCLRWSPTGRMFDLKGKIIAIHESVR